MSRIKSWLPFVLLIIAAAYIVSHSMRRSNEVTANAPEASGREPTYVADDATWIRYGTDGNPMIRAQAQRIDYYDDRSAVLTTVVVDRLGGPQGHWHLEAPKGTVPANQQRMLLQPDVNITGETSSQLPTTIAARDVWVDWDKRTISSDQPIRGNAPNRAVSAKGWQTDFDASSIQMKGNVEVQYDAPPRR
ncbi:LPS export ABC transporter periplasmic protein LptC [Solimonas marina]|uniref:LPS export ABC transporter periplasmic protein LptC n=1 Tax=Solimonas marina TaxID=2714601 RepID=A0A969W942_9GAMM|nr:LPS export ABC transporter periplasmic protein LptC [Solimonas marina]NKF22907.1 LPS export ABC transporter periplasmic protein LptC [Solimonas marina]